MSWQKLMDLVREKCLFKWLNRSGKVPGDLGGVSVTEAYKMGFSQGYWGGVEDGVAVGTDVGIITLPPQQRNDFAN